MNAKSPEPLPAQVREVDPQPTQEVLEALRPYVQPGKEQQAAVMVQRLIVQEYHQGPLPRAQELAAYDVAHPGTAERIVAMAEREQGHRHGLETKVVVAEAGIRSRGQWIAFVSLLAMLGVVALFMFNGHPVAGAWLGGAIIVAVVVAFLGQQVLVSHSVVVKSPPESSPAKPLTKQAGSGKRRRR